MYTWLTSRQREVLALIADGFCVLEIADILSIDPRTVNNHTSTAKTRLGTKNRTQTVTVYLLGVR
jgi:DNA-binding NarL/FixJ family response regulator